MGGHDNIYLGGDRHNNGNTGKEENSDGRQRILASITVQLKNGIVKLISDVVIVDRVRVCSAGFSTIHIFMHKQRQSVARILTVDRKQQTQVTLTRNNFMYTNGKLVAARDVAVGDFIQLEHGALVPVVAVIAFLGKGFYNARAVHGDIVVNNSISPSADIVAVEVPTSSACSLRFLYCTLGSITRISSMKFRFLRLFLQRDRTRSMQRQ